MNRVVITELTHKEKRYSVYLLLDERREPVELQVFAPEEESLVGQIYVGYVEKLVASVHAAFVRIGGGRKCFLPLEDLQYAVFSKRQSEKKPICEGDELLVQVVKDAVKTKDAVVSTKLSLHGSYCLLTMDGTGLCVSRRLPRERAMELKALAGEVCAGHEAKGYGLVLRTNAGEQSAEALRRDIEAVVSDYERLLSTGVHKRQGELLYRNLPGYLTRLKGQELSDVDQVCTDVPAFYEEIAGRLPALRGSGKLVLYDDPAVSLSVLYQLGSRIQGLLAPRVWLPSGANIIIEALETMTVIDVNSGKNTSKKESALFAINLEAAREIARQLRLRNISGMILVDFINMESEEQKNELIACLKSELKQDRVPTRLVDITGLGLVELTRKKVYRSLRELLR